MCKIIATLNEGKNYSKLCFLSFLSSILLFFMDLVTFYDYMIYKYNSYIEIIIVYLFLSILLFFLGVKFNNQGKRIKKYLKSSVEVNANVYELDYRIERGYRCISRINIKVCIKFKYEGKIKIFKSEYRSIYKKCIGENIKVLYSPSYNEILFVKNNTKKEKK